MKNGMIHFKANFDSAASKTANSALFFFLSMLQCGTSSYWEDKLLERQEAWMDIMWLITRDGYR